MAKSVTGKELISAAWSALKQDKELMMLPVLGGIFSVMSVAVISSAGFFAGAFTSATTESGASSSLSIVGWVFAALMAYATTTIALFFQSAVIFGATERLNGENPSVTSALGAAFKKLGPIMLWSLVATTVGLILRAISERGGAFARIGSAIAGIAWSAATFFVLPIVIFEGINSFTAVKRSGQLISERWGAVARTSIRFGFRGFLAVLIPLAAIVGGVGIMISSIDSGTGPSPVLGLAIALIGLICFVAVMVVMSALNGYVRAVLYRYAVGQSIPGISEDILARAFPLKS